MSGALQSDVLEPTWYDGIRIYGPKPTQNGGQVYRCFDYHRQLLYVGSSKDARRRLRQHRECSEWYLYAYYLEIENWPSRKEAFAQETLAQRTETIIKIPINRRLAAEASDRFNGFWKD